MATGFFGNSAGGHRCWTQSGSRRHSSRTRAVGRAQSQRGRGRRVPSRREQGRAESWPLRPCDLRAPRRSPDDASQHIPPRLMLCDKTLRLRVDERSVPTRYIQIILGLAEVRRQIEIAATGTSGSMKNISQQSIRQLMIPLGSPEDVKCIVEVDILHEDRTSALRREAEGLRLLKQGLMDDLLMGQIGRAHV